MKIGTKSVLFGAHCFFIHPIFVFIAWWKLFGFPYDPRLRIAFIVHDLGYFGKPNMDGEEGESHPYLGAKIVRYFFDKNYNKIVKIDGNRELSCHRGVNSNSFNSNCSCGYCKASARFYDECNYWYNFTLYHSRFLAKRNDAKYSKLCVADKYAICLTPSWLYVPMATATGEIKEYMKDFEKSNYTSPTFEGKRKFDSRYEWHKAVKKYVKSWVEEHKDMKDDLWTPKNRQPINKDGVWK